MKNTWRFGDRELFHIQSVLDSGFASGTTGNLNNNFEQLVAEKEGAKYAIAMNSGTSTLHAALYAAGVRYGDEVITAPLTVISNLDVIVSMNAIPVFADIDPATYNIDPDDVARKITSKTKALMPISLYGLSCDLDPIMKLAEEHNLIVVNDAAEAFGAYYKGQQIAKIAHITSYSTENSKHITTGEGGLVVTNDSDLATHMRKFSSLGYRVNTAQDGRVRSHKDIFQNPEYKRHDTLGYNYRLSEVAAAMGLAQAERMEEFIQLRIDIAEMYLDVVKDCAYLMPQKTPEGYKNTYWSVAMTYERDDLSWQDFRYKYMDYGGDGIYAAWALLYQEEVFASQIWRKHCPPLYETLEYPAEGMCPNAEAIQPKIMQFVNNYGSVAEAEPKIDALRKTIEYFA
jgi:perosamine synthetase